ELVQRLLAGPVRYRGIMGYEGHAVLQKDPDERRRLGEQAIAVLGRHVDALKAAGLAPEIVSAGGTGTNDVAGRAPQVSEVQAGSSVFMDVTSGVVPPDRGRPALTLLTTVIARHGDIAIIDAGLKSLTMEFGPPQGKDLPVSVLRLSEEHGHLNAGG